MSQGIPFYLSVGWEGKGVCPPDVDWSPSEVLPMLGDHIWFLNQRSPFFSLLWPDNGTCLGWDGGKDSCPRTSWAASPRCQSQPLWPSYSFLLPSNPATFRDEGVIRTEVTSDFFLCWVLPLQALLPVQVKSEGF